MEGITRLVAESMARHGVESAVDHRRLQWSRWFRCESGFSHLPIPCKPGLFALAEELVAPGEVPATGGKRMLAIFQISEAEELGVGMTRIFAPGSSLYARLKSGRIFARFTVIEDDTQRQAALTALQRWLAASAELATGIAGDFHSPALLSPELADTAQSAKAVHSEQIHGPSIFPAGF